MMHTPLMCSPIDQGICAGLSRWGTPWTTRRHSNQRRDTGADGSARYLRGRHTHTATTNQSSHRHIPRASHGTVGRA
eukprot:708740-Prymnesium_polylepis.1